VALEPAQLALLEPLAREQEVHAEAPPHPADAQEQVDELGPARQQLAELVDHHEQVGHRRKARVLLAGLAVGADVVDVAGVAQHRLTALLLAQQRVAHAVDQAAVALEVRDQPGGVRKPRQLGERRAALVVDQHERQRLGRVTQRQPGDQRAQQLALAGAGGAHDQPVRPQPALGGLLEVERDRLARGAESDRHSQLVAAGARPPARRRVRVGHRAQPE
jgi:hypothetical protein